MPSLTGPVLATSATGDQLTQGPPGPAGVQGTPGAAGPQGAQASNPPWTRVNTSGGPPWLISGSTLTNAQTAELMDTRLGNVNVVAPLKPADDQPLTIKDGYFAFGTHPGALQCQPTQKAEIPGSNPPTLSLAGALVSCWQQAGASTTWTFDIIQNTWLLD
jgi:hypothetical protein